MDTLLDRVRAADPVHPGEFADLDDFDALAARLEVPHAPRRRRRLLALPAAAGALVAALALLPASAPQAAEIARRAGAAITPGDGILYAKTDVSMKLTDGTVERYGSSRIWVRQAPGEKIASMRWLKDDGAEEVTRPGDGTGVLERYVPAADELSTNPGMRMVPGDIFAAGEKLRSARAGTGGIKLAGEATVNGRPAYVLRWHERSGPPHWPTIEQTLWVDRETYAPLRFSGHDSGRDASGQALDQTSTETVLEFRRLPDTPENRRLLEMSEHPGAKR